MRLKSLWIIVLVLALLIVCVFIGAAGWFSIDRFSQGANIPLNSVFSGEVFAAQDFKAESDESETLTFTGETLEFEVNNEFGDISIRGGDRDDIIIKVHRIAMGSSQEDATANLDQLTYETSQEDGRIIVQSGDWNVSQINNGSLNFSIEVPRNMTIDLQTGGGNIQASNLEGDIALRAVFGNIDLRNAQGGTIFVESQNGEIVLESVFSDAEAITVKNNFGTLTMADVTGKELKLSTQNGKIEAVGLLAEKTLSLTSTFGDIQLRDSKAQALEIQSQNGVITLDDLAIEAKIIAHTEFGNIDLKNALAASYDLESKNGKISLDGANQALLKISSDFGDIDLANTRAATLDLMTKNGNIIFRGSLAPNQHRVTTEFGNITLRLPDGQSLGCDLSTQFGSISSEFDFTMTGTFSEKRWVGKINSGGGLLTVETQNGTISLEKSLAEE